MADLAERVDDLICSFDSASDTTMDTLSMLIFGWMLFGLVVLCVGKYVYNRFVLSEGAKDGHVLQVGDHVMVAGSVAAGKLLSKAVPAKTQPATAAAAAAAAAGQTTSATSVTSGASGAGAGFAGGFSRSLGSSGASSGHGASGGTGYVPPTPPVRKRLTRKTSGPLVSPARSSRALHLPTATGADAEAVRWVNELIVWLHSDLSVLNELLVSWVISLNDFLATAVDEVNINVAGGCYKWDCYIESKLSELTFVRGRLHSVECKHC